MINEYNKVLFIINRKSGTGYRAGLEGRILNVCRTHEVECTLEFTKGRGHATELAQWGVAEKFDLVVAVGGDGTLNEVAQGLIHTQVPMGILPNGSGNGFARHLGIPVHIGRAADCLFKSSAVSIDTFTINDRLSLNVSGIGFDGHIAEQFDKAQTRGLMSYARITVREYNQFKEFEATVSLNGESLVKQAFVIAIANSSQYGNNARIAPHASVCDQKLHVCLLHKMPPYRADIMFKLFSGRIDRTVFCEMLEAGDFTVSFSHPVPYHIDGEPGGTNTHFNIRILPASLRILVPTANQHKI